MSRRPLHEMAGSLYYLMAKRREERGCRPDGELAAHAAPGCAEASDGELGELLDLAPLATHTVYQASLVDMQRHAALNGFELLFAEPTARHNKPAF